MRHDEQELINKMLADHKAYQLAMSQWMYSACSLSVLYGYSAKDVKKLIESYNE
jgi:hypothetical protein